jgi:hypothetical protein
VAQASAFERETVVDEIVMQTFFLEIMTKQRRTG